MCVQFKVSMTNGVVAININNNNNNNNNIIIII